MNPGLEIRTDYPLLTLNTFGINAVASRFVSLASSDDFKKLIESGLLRREPFFVLGGGSNVVFCDDYKGVIVHPVNKGIRLLSKSTGCVYVEAEAGEVWSDFVDYCIDNQWFGLENLAGIPGCVGASPVQNVGAYGKEAKDFIDRVHLFDIQTGEQLWMDASQCGFGYRWSVFKGEMKNRFLIDKVVFRLSTEFCPDLQYKALSSALSERGIDSPTARQLADTVKQVRDSKLPDPKKIGSAGSFFKNPVVSRAKAESLLEDNPDMVVFPVGDAECKLAAGWLIEHCGWKGRTIGNVGVYEKQALVLVNRGGCSGAEVKALSDAIINDVESIYGVRLECEAIFV